MIFKSFIVEKNISSLDNFNAVLFYGENIGLKDDLKKIIKSYNKDYEYIPLHQNDIIKDPDLLNEQVFNISLFSKKKIIFINDFTDKLKNKVIDVVKEKKEDIKIFIFGENLDKKSFTRSYFEKEKNLAIVPCYQDNEKTLSIYLRDRLKDYNGLSQDLVNILINNSGSDRKVLSQEIDKIKGLFSSKKIDGQKVMDLMNNSYNIDFDHLRDTCLEANKEGLNKNLGNISLQNEKAYLYLSSINIRVQKLMELNDLLNGSKNIDLAIDEIKPKIFWKDKPVFKKQLSIWDRNKLEKAKKIIFQTEIIVKTKLGSLSDILIKKMLIELCSLAATSS